MVKQFHGLGARGLGLGPEPEENAASFVLSTPHAPSPESF
jgi:hypothetical protein